MLRDGDVEEFLQKYNRTPLSHGRLGPKSLAALLISVALFRTQTLSWSLPSVLSDGVGSLFVLVMAFAFLSKLFLEAESAWLPLA